jgi:DNA-binding transcriptional LysR family regulator
MRKNRQPASPAFDLELRQLRAFVALVENGGVTAASKALNHAQSTVSEAISALERTLGTALTHHKQGSRPVSLTESGRALLPRARDVLAAVDRAYATVVKEAVSAHDVFNIVANESVSTYVLSHVLRTIRERWPNTRFSVSVATCAEIHERFNDSPFHLALLLEKVKKKALVNKIAKISNRSDYQVVAPLIPLVVFAAPKHPLASPASSIPVRRSALHPFSLFVSDPAGDYREFLERFFREDRLPGPRLESTGTVEGVKTAVLNDTLGLGLLPWYAIAEELRRGQFIRLDLLPALPQLQIVAWLSRSKALHPCIRQLLDDIGRLCANRQGRPPLPTDR